MGFDRNDGIGFPSPSASHIADAKVDYATPGLDTEAEVIVAINTANTKINSILTALEAAGIVAST